MSKSPLNSYAFENVNSVNSEWNQNNQSMDGVRPPVPQLSNFEGKYSSLPQPEPQLKYNLVKISSSRDPYAVQYLVNGYGSMSTRLGTNMGS